MLTKFNETLVASPIDSDKLAPLKLSLNEKLTILKVLDNENMELVSEGDLTAKIKKTHEFTGCIMMLLYRWTNCSGTCMSLLYIIAQTSQWWTNLVTCCLL